MRIRPDDRSAAALFILLLALIPATLAQAQAPPIVGSAPVLVRPSNATPQTADSFTVDVAVDLSNTTGTSPSGTAPAALSAFRIPLAFDRARLQLVSVGAGQDPLFAPAGVDATPVASANANGIVVVTATLAGGPAPSGIVSVATLTFQATAAGPAGIAADANATSLASAIQGSAATLFGPAAIAPRAAGGGVVVQTPAALRVTVTAGPSPINTNGRLIYTIRVENTGGATASGVSLSAAIPANTTFLAASAGGTQSGATVQWNAGSLAGGLTFDASLAVTVNGAAGSSVAGLSATASASNASNASATSASVNVVAKAIVKPGSIVTMTSYGGESGTIYDITTGTPKVFGRIASAGWAGALFFTPDGTLYATSNAYGGALFDATAGGDLTQAAPIARNLGNRITGIARDASGNVYVSSEESGIHIKRIAPDGSVTSLPPVINWPGGLLVNGTTLYVAEGGSGSVKKIDLNTNVLSTHATGFPTGQHFFSGQLVRTAANRLFVLWGQNNGNRGLFEITNTNGGAININAPLTAANAFRIDINELATDAANNIYFGGNGSGAVYRATPNGSGYNAAAVFAPGVPECESLAIYPRPQATLLVLSATASMTETYAGRDVVYTLAYENAGATAATPATLTFQIPTGTNFISASGGGTSNGSTVTWNISSIAGGATGQQTVTVRTTASGGTTLNSTATISGNGSTATTSLPPVAVLAPPVLSVIVTASTSSVPNGSHVLYTIQYSNTGGAAAPATEVRNLVPASSALAGTFDGGVVVAGSPEWDIGTLAAGASGSVSFAVRATGAAGSTINNNACTINATAVATSTATPVVTSITAATRLTTSIKVGPTPVIPGTQVNVYVTILNDAAPAATNAIVTVPIPPDSEVLSITGGGVAGGGNVTWTFANLPVSATAQTVRYSYRTHAEPGLRTSLAASVRSDQHPLFTSAPKAFEVRALPTTYVPGTVLSGETFIAANLNEIHNVRIVNANNTLTVYTAPPRTNWLGALHIAKNRHLYAVTKWPTDDNGAIWDLTAGGDLLNAAPLAEGLGGDLVDITSDDAGNIYCVRRLPEVIQRIRKITPEGEVSIIGPDINAADGLIWVDGWIYYSEGNTGRVLRFDPNNPTAAPIVHVTGLPTSRDHFSGHFIRNQQNRLFVLWGIRFGPNLGLFDITNPLTYTSSTQPVTAKDAFTTDMNQMGLGLDNSIWFSGNGARGIWRAPFVNGAYGPTVRVGNFDAGDNEALAIVPALELTVTAANAPARAFNGDTLTWTLTATNTSTFDVHDAFIESPLPSGSAFIAANDGGSLNDGVIRWNIGTLAAGASASVSFTARVTAAEGTTITLQNYLVDGAEVIAAYGAAKNVAVERPLAIGASAQPLSVVVGQNVVFTLRYENLNTSAATNSVIRATVPAGATHVSGGTLSAGVVTFSLGNVGAGAAGEVAFTVRADALPSIVLATYSIASTEFGTRNGVPLTVEVVPPPFDLRVSASAAEEVTSGETLTYTLTYANDGGSTAPQTLLSSIVPEGTTFAASTGGGSLENGRVVWNLGALAGVSVAPPSPAAEGTLAGEGAGPTLTGSSGSVAFDVTVTADGGATITNDDVTIVSGSQTRVAEAISTSVLAPPAPPALAVAMLADPSPVTAGELLAYSITITNPDDEAATGVVVSTNVPNDTSFVSATGAAEVENGTIQWNLGPPAAGASTTLSFTVRVDASAGDTITSAGASVFATARDAGSSGPVTTNVIRPPSALRLTIAAPESVAFGENITYTLTFANDGPSAAAGARLTDPLPAGTTFVSASNGGSLANGIVTWNLGTIAAGGSGTRTLIVATTQAPGSTVANSGSALSVDGSPTAHGGTALTGIVAPALVVDGAVTTNKSEYFAPEAVEQRGTFTYEAGGVGFLAGLTATLTTTNASGGGVIAHTELFDPLVTGQSASIAFDWNTASAASGTYDVTFTVADANGATLFTASKSITIHARDGAGLTGTIQAAPSPVAQGTPLVAHFTVANASPLDYDPLALAILVTDAESSEPIATIPASASLPAGGNDADDVEIATGNLALGDYGLWLVTTDGGGRLLATTTFTVAAPLLSLEPSAITITAGTSGTLTAKLTAPAANAVTLTLASSHPGIASVPATITIPAGASSQTFAVQGVSIGGPATITATLPTSLGGGSASSTVLVVATGSLTATLQVYQGENVSFGVTITNSGNADLVSAPFTIDIVDPNSGNVIDTIPLTVTVAAGATFTTTLQHDTSDLAFQTYAAQLVYHGVDPAQKIAEALFTVLEPPPLRLEAGVGSKARVLIWANCSPGNSGQPCTPVPPPFLTQTLDAAGIRYVVVGEENAFLALLRTGGFTAVVLDQLSAAEPRIADEVVAAIHAGTGLLFIHGAPNAMPKLAPALGVHFNGKQNGPTSLQLLDTPFTTAGSLTLNGDRTRITLEGAQAAANVAGTPAIAYHTFGRGRSVTIPFDLELTPSLDVARLILGSIQYVSRVSGPAYIAREVVPLHISVTTPPGGEVPVVVTVTLPNGASVVDAAPPLTSTNPLQWSVTIAGNTTASFDLWVRLPDAIGIATVTVSASLPGGPPIITKTVEFDVTANAASLKTATQTELTTLRAAATRNPDVNAIDAALAQLNALNADAAANVARVLRILEELAKVSIDTGPARAAADRLLVYWQSKVV